MSGISRREFGKTVMAGLDAAAVFPGAVGKLDAAENRKQPNIVFICSDQHSHRYNGYAGHPLVETPNLDRIARSGVVFTNAYSGNPVCAPGRTSLMTGMYASDCNSFCNSTVWDGSHPVWGTYLTEAGYDCRAIGKMDLNDDFDTGFQEISTGHAHRHGPDITSLFRRPACYRMGERPGVNGGARDRRHRDSSLADQTTSFIRDESVNLDQPWTFYSGFHLPHPRFLAPKEYYEMYPVDEVDMPVIPPGYLENQHLMFQELRHFKRIATPIPEDRIRRARAAYYGMVSELDQYVGWIWDELKRTGQLDNTVFVYTSDHGESLGEHGLWYKNNLYDNAANIPLVMAGAGLPKGEVVNTPVAHVDLAYTLLELAGAQVPSSLRGHSLLPLMNGEAGQHPGFAYSESHSEGNCTGSFMIRRGDWKYIHFTWYSDLLFNVAEDPGEFNNLMDDPGAARIRDELRDILHSQVDPEEVTRRGFRVQRRVLQSMTDRMTEDELFETFKSRLGPGLARAMAARCKAEG